MASRATTRRVRQAANLRRPVVAGYLRLSEDRNGVKIGYDVQQKAIQRWADAHDYEVVWFKDEDITAGDRKKVRKHYERMLSEVGAGKFLGIVVWRLDRLVRLTREFERCFGVVEDADCFIYDVESKLSTESEVGKMIVRILVMFAEMELTAMRARARAHQQWKAEHGILSGGGFRPFGFVGVERDPVTKKIVNQGQALIAHVPDEAALIRKAADQIVKHGASFADVAREWEAAGIKGTNGKWVGLDALIQILTRPRIAGLREYEIEDDETGEITVDYSKAVWDPILDRQTWESIRRLIKQRGARSQQKDYLLTDGLIVCDICGTPMIGNATKDPKTGQRNGNYRCNPSLNAKKNGACGGPLVRADYVEDTVLELMFARFDETPQLIDLVHADDDAEAARKVREANDEIREVDIELADVARMAYLPRDHPDRIDRVAFKAINQTLLERKAEAERIIEINAALSGYPVPVGDERNDIRGWFDGLGHGQKRSFLRRHVQLVAITRRLSARKVFDPNRVKLTFADAEHLSRVRN